MLFLIGWGRKTTKDFGPTIPVQCPNCDHQSFWRLWQVRTWATLFFIPVLPYENKHVLLCPRCEHGVELSPDRVEAAKALVEVSERYIRKAVSDEEFEVAVKESRLLTN